MDVFHAVKQVKVSRPEFVPNKVESIIMYFSNSVQNKIII